MGVSSYNGFDKNQTVSDFIVADLKFSLSYKITGGPDDGKSFDIGVRNCTTEDLNQLFAFDPADADVIKAHVDANQFFCPKAFDLSFYGLRDSLSSKMISVKLQSSGSARANNYLANKKLAVLIN